MAYKATRDTFGFSFVADALGVSGVKLRRQVMAGHDFPPGVEPEDKDAVEEFSPQPYAGPAYRPESITLDERIAKARSKGKSAKTAKESPDSEEEK